MKITYFVILAISLSLIGCTKKDKIKSFTCSNTDFSKTHSVSIDSEGKFILYDGRKLLLRNARLGEDEWSYAYFIGNNNELVAFSFNENKTLYHHYTDARNDSNSYDEYGGCKRP